MEVYLAACHSALLGDNRTIQEEGGTLAERFARNYKEKVSETGGQKCPGRKESSVRSDWVSSYSLRGGR